MGRTKNPETLSERIHLRLPEADCGAIEEARLRYFPEMESQVFMRRLLRLGLRLNEVREAGAEERERSFLRSGGGAAELKGKTEAAG